MNPDVLVRLTNQLKTIEPLVATLRYASPVYRALAPTARYGTPDFVQAVDVMSVIQSASKCEHEVPLKKLGALPVTAREYNDRDERYKNELPDDQAEMMIPVPC